MNEKQVIEYLYRDKQNGEFWIDIKADGAPFHSIGPFETESARQRCLDDVLNMARSMGAVDLPVRPQ